MAQNLEGMDLLQGVRDAAQGDLPFPEDAAMPSIEQLLEELEKMDLPEAQKESLRKTLTDALSGEDLMAQLLKPAFDILPSGNPLMQYVLVVAFLVVLTIFVFFGYKLYRSLTEKERKRDEKRKQKQLKKKK